MAFANWRPQYLVGVTVIDEQHKVMFGLINELHESLSKGHANDILDGILDRLILYTTNHFREEEAAMAGCGYPELAIHKREHDILTRQVLELQSKFRNGSALISLETMMFLTNWLDQHILKADLKFAPHLVR